MPLLIDGRAGPEDFEEAAYALMHAWDTRELGAELNKTIKENR